MLLQKNGKRANFSNNHNGQHVNMVANSPKGTSKKALNSMTSPIASPSPAPSPNAAALRPPTPQPQQIQYQQQHHMQQQQQHSHLIQQYPTTTMLNANNQLVQIIQGPTIMSPHSQQHLQQQQQHVQQRQNSTHSQQHTIQSSTSIGGSSTTSKQNKMPQQILPKPANVMVSSSPIYNQPVTTVQTSSSNGNNKNNKLNQQQSVIATNHQTQQQHQSTQGAPILLPTSSLNHQQLMINQMPMLVQQNTPQGVQLILRQPQQQPQLTTQGLVIHNNNRPQMQPQQSQPQLLRILNTNGTPMQLTSNTPTFIVSSQANLIHQQQNMQTIKTASPITQIQTLSNQAPQLATTINGQFGIGRGVTQIQNLQLNGNLTHIQMPNGLNGQLFSQLPPNFQQQLASYNPNINFNQLSSANFQQIAAAAAAAAASGATFQSPPPAQTGDMVVTAGVQSIQFAQNNNNSGQMNVTASIPSSPIMTHGGHILPSVTPEPRQPTPITLLPPNTVVIQDTKPSPASTPTPSIQIMDVTSGNSVEQPALPPPPPVLPKTPKKPKKPRAKKSPVAPKTVLSISHQYQQPSYMLSSTTSSSQNQSTAGNSPADNSPSTNHSTATSTGKLDLANVMKLCGIMEDDDEFMDTDEVMQQPTTQPDHMTIAVDEQQQATTLESNTNSASAACPGIMVTIPYSHNTDVPYSFTIPATSASSMPTSCTDSGPINITVNTKIGSPTTEPVSSQHNSSGTTPKNESNETHQQYTIKIDHNDANSGEGFPLTISIPKITDTTTPTAVLPTPAAAINNTSMCVPSFVNSVLNSTVTPTLQSQINEIQNQLMGVGNLSESTENVVASTTVASVSIPLTTSQITNQTITTPVPSTAQHSTIKATPASVVPTQPSKPAAAKPPRKRPAKKSTKKPVNTITPVNVPSQIGNIQISQVDTSKGVVPGMHQKLIENQIQITPIIDNKSVSSSTSSVSQPQPQPQPQMQTNQIVHHAPSIQQTSANTIQESNIQTASIPSQPPSHQIQITSQPQNNPLPQPMLSHSTSLPTTQAAQTIPQLTGSLSLSLVEDGRLILRHNPNQPQDAQSQMILQAILSGALCNVTLINEPIIVDKTSTGLISQQQQPTIQPSPTCNSSANQTNRSTNATPSISSPPPNQIRSASSATAVMTTTTTTKNATVS